MHMFFLFIPDKIMRLKELPEINITESYHAVWTIIQNQDNSA